MLEHNQGMNPPDFDYGFNLSDDKKCTNTDPLFTALRNIVDQETKNGMNTKITIRSENAADIDAITRLTEAAFRNEEHSSHTEQFIVNALRRDDQLPISLVAEGGETIVGHVAISPVTISLGASRWYGSGPISVCHERQGQGIGSMLMEAALTELRSLGGQGCVVLGDPGYYGRFGFKAHAGLVLPGVPHEYFQALSLGGETPEGDVSYHESFDATE